MRISVYSFIISAILLTTSCSSINKKCKDITFGELSKDVQDTLQCVSQKVIEDYSPKAMIDFLHLFQVLCGSVKCKFTEKSIGPWIIGIQIEDTVNNVSVSLPSNVRVVRWKHHLQCPILQVCLLPILVLSPLGEITPNGEDKGSFGCFSALKAFTLTGRLADCHYTQGDALG